MSEPTEIISSPPPETDQNKNEAEQKPSELENTNKIETLPLVSEMISGKEKEETKEEEKQVPELKNLESVKENNDKKYNDDNKNLNEYGTKEEKIVEIGGKSNRNQKKNLNKDLDITCYRPKKRRYKDKAEEEQAITSTMLRFSEEDKRRKENLEKIKKRIEEDESKTCYKIPKINKYSKEITSRINEDFLTRQKKLEEKHKKLHEFLEKKRMEEIKNGNKAIKVGKKGKTVERKEKMTGADVNKMINKLYDWDKKRKAKLESTQKKRKQNEISKVKSCPAINKKSKALAAKQNPKRTVNGTFERLYRGDNAKKKERLKILTQIYTPTFKPQINSVRNSSAKFNSNKSQILKNSASSSCIMSVDVEDVWRSKIMGKMNKNKLNSSMVIRNKNNNKFL